MKKLFTLRLFLFTALLNFVENNIHAQVDAFRYCIYVKQEFSSWCDCSGGGAPSFRYADIGLNSDNSVLSRQVLGSSNLNQLILLSQMFHYDGVDKAISNLIDNNQKHITSVSVHTYANNIVNDHELDYAFDVKDLRVGANSKSSEASDPCHNFISSNREGYTMTTTVYIDDPIHLENASGKSSFCLDYENITLKVSDYYVNDRGEKPVLQVALDNGEDQWQTLTSVSVYPKATITLSYPMIAGKKDVSTSNYFAWMGHNLKFRVVKTLHDGTQTNGSQVAAVKFFPQGLQYSILQTGRTFCNNNVVVTVQLENGADEGYFTRMNSNNNYYWAVVEGDYPNYSSFFYCTMQNISGNIFSLTLKSQQGDTVDPFSEPNVTPRNWKLQLIEKDHLENYSCVKSFSIPTKPPAVSVAQNPAKPYTVNGTAYHVPDMNHPFAMLNIDDPYTFASLRKPYTVYEGSSELLKLSSLPNTYDEMTPAEKAALDAQFEVEFSAMISQTNNPYKSYFIHELSNWMNSNPNGIPLSIPVLQYGFPCMFSKDGTFFIYQDWKSGVQDLFYKAIINSDGTFTIEQKTSNGSGGASANDISPDGKTLLYTIGTCCSGITDWKVPLDISGSNNATQLTLPSTCPAIGRFGYFNTTNIFFDNNNIIISDNGASTNGLYKKSINSATNIKMYSGVAKYPSLSPDLSFVIFMDNSNNLYKGTVSGNSITGVTLMSSNCELLRMSPDGTYALVTKNSKTYKVPLNGVGSETEAIARSLNNYFSNYALTKDGRCFYYYSGTSPDYSDRGFYVSNLNGGIGTKINSTYGMYLTMAPNQKYLLYSSYNNPTDKQKIFKLYLGLNEATSDLYPNVGIAASWYSTFKASYKQLWLYQRVGVKVTKGIRVNETQHLVLKDNDQCSYPFDIYVSAPPQPSFSHTIESYPSDACAHNGSVKITYNGGGSTPYKYGDGTLASVGNSIVVTGLSYGDNTVQLFDNDWNPSATYNASIGSATIGLTSTPTTDQTCPTANGSVTINVGNVSGNKYYTLTCDYPHTVYTSAAITANSYKFSGLPTGTYKAEVTSGTCYFAKENISVGSKIFNITTPISATDATTLNGTGGVSIAFANRVNNVTWVSGTPSGFNPSESTNNPSYSGINPSTYNILARHTDSNGACNVSKSFTISKPQFAASINLEENDTMLNVRTSLSGVNLLLSPFKIRLLNSNRTLISESTSNGILSTDIQNTGSYIINLQYGSSNEVDLYSFNYPLGSITNGNNVNPPTCPGGNATITLTPTGGIDGSNFLFSLNGAQYTSTNVYNSTAGTFSYYIKDENTVSTDVYGNVVTVNKSLVKHFELPVTEPARVAAQKVIPVNVTCYGLNNGSVSIANLSGGSGVYQYKVDDGNWVAPSGNVTGLTPGQYKVYLKDSQNNCSPENIGTITIKEPEPLKIDTISIVHPKCELSNGSIKVEIKGGSKPYKYDWTFNGAAYLASDTTSDTITNLEANLSYGLYHLHVADYFNCELQQSVTLNQYYNPVIGDVSVTDVKCYGESNGSATILSTTGTKRVIKSYIKALDFLYNDTITDITQAFDTLKKSRYEIYVIDSLHCRSNSPYIVSIHQPDTVLYLIVDTIIPVVDKGSSSGSIKSIVYGGNDGLKDVKLLNSLGTCLDSSLQKNDFAFFLPTLKAGNYSIWVSDRKGCSFKTGTLKVNEPDTALGFRVISKQNALCKSQTGSITVQGYGGWGGYKYKRASYNSYYTRNTFEPLYAGNYLITVQDSHGAIHSDTVVIYEPKDSLKSWISKSLIPACSNNGSLQISVLGGTAPYSILNLTTNSTITAAQPKTVDFDNLSAGKYIYNVTDSNGCHFDLETQLPDTGLLEIVRLEPVYPSGIATSDGAIKAKVKGRLPYSYQWKQRFGNILPVASSTLSNIPSGHYQLTVSETSGCSDTAFIYLPGINDIAFHIAEVRDETSYLAHNGYCTLTSSFNSWQKFELITSSGTPVLFNPSDSTANFYCKNNAVFLKNLSGGDYFISGTASSGEKIYAQFRIEPYIHFQISNIDIVNVDTIGGSNGRIAVVTSGGGGKNRFTWEKITTSGNSNLVGENYPESSILSNISAGKYRLTVTDQYNNAIYDTIVIHEPGSPLTISIAEYQHESCKTYEDAYVVLHAEGGWGDYQFRDDNTPYFTNGNMFYNLDVRKHDFYLTDKKGITRSISFSIVEPDYLTSRVSFVDSVNCKGASDGNIGFKVKGGTQPYRFMESVIWTQDTIAHNIPSGWHTYLFTDSNNCIGQDTLKVYMPQPDSLLFNRVDITHTTCSTDNGTIKINMRGGTKPYRYEWMDINNAVIGSDTVIHGLQQNGYYTLNVYDWHNCTQHLSQRIKPSINPMITDIGTTPTLCYGDSTGIASVVQIVPGTPYAPCNFTWSNNDTGKIAHGYPHGTHFVTISDTNHCSTIKYFEITQPDSLWVTVIDRKNAHCYGYNDAFLKVEGRGGVGRYQYLWSTGDTTSLANNLYKGDYSVSITDANACNNEKLFTISEPDKLLVNIGDDIKMCPGNSYTLDGKAFATHKWSTNQGIFSNERYVTVKDENNYYLEVTDSIGCFAWDTIHISIGNDALRSDFLMSSQASNGDTLKLFELSNIPLDSLRWSFNDTVFSRVENTTGLDYLFLLKAQENGIYNIDLYAFSGGCVSKSTKQIEIIGENKGANPGDGLGYKDPLIVSLIIAPNPNNGNFRADIKLREVADIDLVLFTVSSGLKIDERSGRGQSEYSIDYNFSQLNSGLYLLILKAKDERKQIKILIQY